MKNFNRDSLRLYAVTDRSWLGEQTLCEQVEEALRGGATMVQIREKELDEALKMRQERSRNFAESIRSR